MGAASARVSRRNIRQTSAARTLLMQMVRLVCLPGADDPWSMPGLVDMVVGFVPDALLACLPVAVALIPEEGVAAHKAQ